MPFDQELLILEPVDRIPDGSCRQGGLTDEILLGQLAAMFEHFIHELCRRRQVPDSSGCIILFGVYNKNDPS